MGWLAVERWLGGAHCAEQKTFHGVLASVKGSMRCVIHVFWVNRYLLQLSGKEFLVTHSVPLTGIGGFFF